MILFRQIVDLILNLWRNNGLPFLNGPLQLLNKVLSLHKILPNLHIFLIQSIDLLQQYNNPQIPFPNPSIVLIFTHSTDLSHGQPWL